MNQKPILSFAILAVAALAVSSINWVNIVTAQQAGDGGFGGAGAAGGGGGGGGIGGSSGSASVAAYGEFVYALRQGTLYQYAAYDLGLIKKIKLRETTAKNRMTRRAGGFGGGGGGGDGGQGGNAGFGGGFGFMEAGGAPSDGVAAFGEFVYVLQGTTLHKLAADGLTSVKTVTLRFEQ